MNKRLFLAAALVLTPTLFSSVVAQDHGPPAGGSDKNLRDSASDLKGRSNEIERVGRDAKKSDSPPATPPAPNFPEIKEDFERIQIINSDVLQAHASNGKPEYQRVSESAAEIKKRAIRLKSNLFAPKPTKQSKESKGNEAGPEDQELKALLSLLDNAISSFTHSPIFQNSKVVNPQDSTNAQKDLDSIIKISARIINEADRMKATSSPE